MSGPKPALYYSIKGGVHYGGSLRIVAVTSEKRRCWYGRYTRDNTATHGRFGDLTGKFKTPEAAEGARSGIKATFASYEGRIAAAEGAYKAIQRERREAVDQYIIDYIKQQQE